LLHSIIHWNGVCYCVLGIVCGGWVYWCYWCYYWCYYCIVLLFLLLLFLFFKFTFQTKSDFGYSRQHWMPHKPERNWFWME